MKESSKVGRHTSLTPCTHCVMVRFDDLEWDKLLSMMDKADEKIKATFIKQIIFGKPFKVLVTDKSLAVYCAKLSEFFSQFRTVGVNYNLIVKELRSEFSEKKALQYLYKLEKATVEMAKILAEVKALTVRFDEAWSQKISIGSSLYGALTYNSEKINEAKGRVLGANKIVLPPDGNINIGKMVENFKAFMPKMGKTKKPVLHISLNPHPEDKLTDQDFEILAREYLDKLGFGEQPYILYKHEDIDRHHIHIVTVNVNEQGKRLNQDFLYRRSKKITTELEEKYGLHKAQREKISPDTPITKIDPSGDIKRQVQNTVKLVGMRWKFQTLGEFNAILSLYNIRCEPTDGKVNGREYHGYVYYATNDKGETIATPFKASRLGKFASRTAVEGMFERVKDKIDIKPTKRIVVDVMTRSNGKEDFIANLKEKGIDLILRYNADGRLYGATFIDHNTQTVLNGSRLGREFSANALNAWFNDPAQKPIVQQQPNQSQLQSAPTQPQSSHSQSNSGSQGNSQQTSSQGSTQSSTQSQTSQKSSTPRHSNNDDYSQPTLPGLELFHVGSGYDPEQEAMNREMERRKRKKRRKGRRL